MVREHVIRKWKELNDTHNRLNEQLEHLYGGPDVKAENDATGTVHARDIVAAKKDGLEAGMTDEECDTVYPE